jgi:hypothetical protein
MAGVQGHLRRYQLAKYDLLLVAGDDLEALFLRSPCGRGCEEEKAEPERDPRHRAKC